LHQIAHDAKPSANKISATPGLRFTVVPAGKVGVRRNSRKNKYSEMSGISGPWLYSGVDQAAANDPKPSQ